MNQVDSTSDRSWEQWIGSCNRSRCGKMNVLINYNIYNIILSLYGTSDGSGKERWTVQAIDYGAMDRHE